MKTIKIIVDQWVNVRHSRLAQILCAGGVDPAKQQNQYVPIVKADATTVVHPLSGGPENIQFPARQR